MPRPISEGDSDIVVLSKFFKLDSESSSEFLRGASSEVMSAEERRELANEVRAAQGITLLDPLS